MNRCNANSYSLSINVLKYPLVDEDTNTDQYTMMMSYMCNSTVYNGPALCPHEVGSMTRRYLMLLIQERAQVCHREVSSFIALLIFSLRFSVHIQRASISFLCCVVTLVRLVNVGLV